MDLRTELAKFECIDDLETESAVFLTKVPQIGPEAYLNSLYKPVAAATLGFCDDQVRMPPPLSEFYQRSNGAHLFVNTLSIYGCVISGQLIDRSPQARPGPFSLYQVNRELNLIHEKHLCIGSYGYDGSLVLLDRESAAVTCVVGEDLRSQRWRWRSIDEWLITEIRRMSMLFDPCGMRLVPKEALLPGVNPQLMM